MSLRCASWTSARCRSLGCDMRSVALGLYRRRRFRDQRAGGRSGGAGARVAERSIRCTHRAWCARQFAAGSRPCLYGADIDQPTTLRSKRRLNGRSRKAAARAAHAPEDFPGADIILPQLEKGATRRRVGLRPEGRAPVRAGAALFRNATSTNAVRHRDLRRLRAERRRARRHGICRLPAGQNRNHTCTRMCAATASP